MARLGSSGRVRRGIYYLRNLVVEVIRFEKLRRESALVDIVLFLYSYAFHK